MRVGELERLGGFVPTNPSMADERPNRTPQELLEAVERLERGTQVNRVSTVAPSSRQRIEDRRSFRQRIEEHAMRIEGTVTEEPARQQPGHRTEATAASRQPRRPRKRRRDSNE